MSDLKTLNVTIRYSFDIDPVSGQVVKRLIENNAGMVIDDNTTVFDYDPVEELVSVEFTKD